MIKYIAYIFLLVNISYACTLPTCYLDVESIAADMRYCDYLSLRINNYNACTDKTLDPSYNMRCIVSSVGERYGVMPFTRKNAFRAPELPLADSMCWNKYNTTGHFECLRAAHMMLQYGKNTIIVRIGTGSFTQFRPASMFINNKCETKIGVSFASLINHYMKKRPIILKNQYNYGKM